MCYPFAELLLDNNFRRDLMVLLFTVIALISIAALTFILLRLKFVKPILEKMTTTENVALALISISAPQLKDCSYSEYLNEFSEIYKQTCLLYENTMLWFWKQNNTLLNILMLKSEREKCSKFIENAYSHQEKYFEYYQSSICANYYD